MSFYQPIFKKPTKKRKFHLWNYNLSWAGVFFTALGCFCGIGICSYLSKTYDLALLAPSFGASAVLLYAAPNVALAQPRNVIFGHMISAFFGILCQQLFGAGWFGITMGVTVAIVMMAVTDTLHPPGGATALVAVISQAKWSFIFMPIGLGAVILVLVALLTNRFSSERQYPNPNV